MQCSSHFYDHYTRITPRYGLLCCREHAESNEYQMHELEISCKIALCLVGNTRQPPSLLSHTLSLPFSCTSISLHAQPCRYVPLLHRSLSGWMYKHLHCLNAIQVRKVQVDTMSYLQIPVFRGDCQCAITTNSDPGIQAQYTYRKWLYLSLEILL